MSLIVDHLRPYWLPGINEVVGNQQRLIVGWIAAQEYQIYTDVGIGTAELAFNDATTPAPAFAADVNRMAAAAVESIEGIVPSVKLPRSIGWLIIRSYYAAFFAAHAILRMLGRSCTQLEATHVAALNRVADVFGHRPVSLQRGFYSVRVDARARTLRLRRLDASSDGSHGAMWAVFYDLLGEVATDLLSASHASPASQQVAAKLYEIRTVLSNFGAARRGTWLSYVRNRANYQHAFGAWFPYGQRPGYYDALFVCAQRWRDDPMAVPIWPQGARDIQRVVEVCSVITGICRVVSEDMSTRCTRGKSFQQYGAVGLLKRLSAHLA